MLQDCVALSCVCETSPVKDMDAQGSVHYDLAHGAIQATKWQGFKVLLRPGIKGVCDGWLWLFGLPPDAVAVRPAKGLGPATTFTEACYRVAQPDIESPKHKSDPRESLRS